MEVRLSEIAEREGLSVAELIALRDADLRQWMANYVLPAFKWANGLTLAALGLLVILDEANLYVDLIDPSDRIINHQVIMALLGATTVQLGSIAVIIARYLFPTGPAPAQPRQ